MALWFMAALRNQTYYLFHERKHEPVVGFTDWKSCQGPGIYISLLLKTKIEHLCCISSFMFWKYQKQLQTKRLAQMEMSKAS